MTFDPFALAAPGVAGIHPYQPGKPIEALQAELGIDDAVKLASNENPRGPSPRVLQAIARASTAVNRYPDGGAVVLKCALAKELGVGPASITLGNGSNDVLELAVRVFAPAGYQVVYSQHAFAVYALATRAVGARGVAVPARDYGHDLEGMAAALSADTRVVFIANPNNPTGTWVSSDALEQFLARVPPSVVTVVDEAYVEYVDDARYVSALAYLDRFPNLIVTRTFSKVYGLAGLRVGYSVSSAAIADLLNRVRQPFNVNGLAQHAALAALDDPDFVRDSVALNRDEMAHLVDGCDRLGLHHIPSVGNFLSVDLGRPAMPVYAALLERGVIVRPVANYEMPNHLRFTVGLADENTRALTALGECITRP